MRMWKTAIAKTATEIIQKNPKTMKLKHSLITIATAACVLALPSCVEPYSDSGRPSYRPGNSGLGNGPQVRSISSGYIADFGNDSYARFNREGNLVSHSNCDSRRIQEAQRAVRDYMRGDGYGGSSSNYPPSGRPSAPPEVRPRRDGMIEVLMPQGCTLLYSSRGSLIQKGSSCSSDEVRRANDAVQRYLREQGSPAGFGGFGGFSGF